MPAGDTGVKTNNFTSAPEGSSSPPAAAPKPSSALMGEAAPAVQALLLACALVLGAATAM